MGKNLIWTAKCEETFQKIKQYLGGTLVLAKPTVGEDLTLYLSVSERVINSVLV